MVSVMIEGLERWTYGVIGMLECLREPNKGVADGLEEAGVIDFPSEGLGVFMSRRRNCWLSILAYVDCAGMESTGIGVDES
jgi:hypothetical protein